MRIDERRQFWAERRHSRQFHPTMTLVEDRLELGDGTILAQLDNENDVLDGQEARLLALLSVAYERPVPAEILGHIRRAIREWRRGDFCLAKIHLALTGLPKLTSAHEAAYRLFMAEGLLETGVKPRDILRALDFDPTPIDLFDKAYNAAEARIAAGSGRSSGQWTLGGAIGGAISGTTLAATDHFFMNDLAPRTLTGLAELAAGFETPALSLGLLFIPSPTQNIVTQGTIPKHPDLTYRWDQETGQLTFSRQVASLKIPITDAHVGPDGIYLDAERHPIARDVNSALVVNMAAVTGDRQALVIGQTGAKDKPELCPDPGPDRPGWISHSERTKAYEIRITGLPPGIAVKLNGVVFDGCREEDGTMLEAKGPGYAWLIDKDGNWRKFFKKRKDLESQLMRQSFAAVGRMVEWHVAEKPVADKIRAMVADLEISNIIVIWDP